MAKKNSFAVTASIMSIFFIAMGIGTITPALNSIMEAFPDLPLTTVLLVSTLPSLLIIPSTIISGMLAGNKVKYKTLSVIGILLFVAGGVAPFFADNFTVILIERAVFGIGMGILSPLGNSIIIGLYEGDKRASMLGLGTLIMNVGGIVLQFMGGTLANTGWNYSFLPHALGILSLIMVIFFLPEPQKIERPAGAENPKVKLSGPVWVTGILFGATMLITYPLLVGMSTFLVNHNLGGPTTSAVVLAFYTVGGMIGGAVFSNVYKYTKRFTIAISLLLMTLGYVAVLYGGSVVFVIIGTALVGMGWSILFPATMMIIGMLSAPQAVPIATSIVLAFMNVFAFLSTYWIGMIGGLTGDANMSPMFVGMILSLVSGVIFLFISPFPKQEIKKEAT